MLGCLQIVKTVQKKITQKHTKQKNGDDKEREKKKARTRKRKKRSVNHSY